MFAFALFLASATPRPTTAPAVAYFPGNATSASMGTGSSLLVGSDYDNPGSQADAVRFYVRKSGITTLWQTGTFTATAGPTFSGSSFGSFASGWAGAGTYEFWFEYRRVSTGLYDITSNTITLQVV